MTHITQQTHHELVTGKAAFNSVSVALQKSSRGQTYIDLHYLHAPYGLYAPLHTLHRSSQTLGIVGDYSDRSIY